MTSSPSSRNAANVENMPIFRSITFEMETFISACSDNNFLPLVQYSRRSTVSGSSVLPKNGEYAFANACLNLGRPLVWEY